MAFPLSAFIIVTLAIYKCNSSQDGSLISGEYIIRMKTDHTDEDVRKLNSAATWRKKLLFRNHSFLLFNGDASAIQQISKMDSVLAVEPNRLVKLANFVKNEKNEQFHSTDFNAKPEATGDVCKSQANLDDGAWGLVRISYYQLPTYDYSSNFYLYENEASGVDVYVLDSGIDTNHTEFGGRAKFGMQASHMSSPYDFYGHGTHVGGIIGGNVYGVAKKASLISVKVLRDDGTGSTSSILEGLNFVATEVGRKKANGEYPRSVINLSLGSSVYSGEMYIAIQSAIDEGIIVVAMAGNENRKASSFYPAGFDNTITTAATDTYDDFVFSSNYGARVDILAPGYAIGAAGSEDSADCTSGQSTPCFTVKSGTDMAAGFVSGVVARMLGRISTEETQWVDQEFIRNKLIQLASYNKVNTTGGTTSRLLYIGCGADIQVPQPLPPTVPDNKVSKTLPVITVTGLPFLLALLVKRLF